MATDGVWCPLRIEDLDTITKKLHPDLKPVDIPINAGLILEQGISEIFAKYSSPDNPIVHGKFSNYPVIPTGKTKVIPDFRTTSQPTIGRNTYFINQEAGTFDGYIIDVKRTDRLMLSTSKWQTKSFILITARENETRNNEAILMYVTCSDTIIDDSVYQYALSPSKQDGKIKDVTILHYRCEFRMKKNTFDVRLIDPPTSKMYNVNGMLQEFSLISRNSTLLLTGALKKLDKPRRIGQKPKSPEAMETLAEEILDYDTPPLAAVEDSLMKCTVLDKTRFLPNNEWDNSLSIITKLKNDLIDQILELSQKLEVAIKDLEAAIVHLRNASREGGQNMVTDGQFILYDLWISELEQKLKEKDGITLSDILTIIEIVLEIIPMTKIPKLIYNGVKVAIEVVKKIENTKELVDKSVEVVKKIGDNSQKTVANDASYFQSDEMIGTFQQLASEVPSIKGAPATPDLVAFLRTHVNTMIEILLSPYGYLAGAAKKLQQKMKKSTLQEFDVVELERIKKLLESYIPMCKSNTDALLEMTKRDGGILFDSYSTDGMFLKRSIAMIFYGNKKLRFDKVEQIFEALDDMDEEIQEKIFEMATLPDLSTVSKMTSTTNTKLNGEIESMNKLLFDESDIDDAVVHGGKVPPELKKYAAIFTIRPGVTKGGAVSDIADDMINQLPETATYRGAEIRQPAPAFKGFDAHEPGKYSVEEADIKSETSSHGTRLALSAIGFRLWRVRGFSLKSIMK